MSTLITTNIKHASSSSNNIVANSDGTTTLRAGHGVIEKFFSPCDGSTISLPSGNITVQNVTAMIDLSTTWEDLTGSTITYTPPSGTKQVIYEFHFMCAHKDANGIASTSIFLDSDEIQHAKTCWRGDVYSLRAVMTWAFNIGGTTDTDVGRVASWTSDKTIKMQINNYSGSNEAYAHRLVNFGTSTTDIHPIKPSIGITSIG